MKGILGWGLALTGGYVVAKMMGYDPLAMFSGGIPTTTTAIAPSPQASDQISNSGATKNLVITAARAGGVDPVSYQSSDTWDWYYRQVRGISAPAPEDLFPGKPRDTKYSIDEWWAAMVGKGMSGLGLIAHFNPYMNPNGQAFGNNVQANGIETLAIYRSN